eukprot:SAG31_NODE_134_length_23213_cov_5.698624_4_plen_168_part_00
MEYERYAIPLACPLRVGCLSRGEFISVKLNSVFGARRLKSLEKGAETFGEKEKRMHSAYHDMFKENQALKARLKKFRMETATQNLSRARSNYTKVASAAGLNVFEHCKRLERDLPTSSRCLANFQRMLKAIDKHDRELVNSLDREQKLLDLCAVRFMWIHVPLQHSL